jgi:hypothetical protein
MNNILLIYLLSVRSTFFSPFCWLQQSICSPIEWRSLWIWIDFIERICSFAPTLTNFSAWALWADNGRNSHNQQLQGEIWRERKATTTLLMNNCLIILYTLKYNHNNNSNIYTNINKLWISQYYKANYQ